MKRKVEAGLGKLTLLVFGTLIGVIVYCAAEILPFYYYYYELQNDIYSVSVVADQYTDDEVRQKILQRIKELEIPVEPESLIIERNTEDIRIAIKYEEEFYIKFKGKYHTIHIFPFKIDMVTRY